MNGDFVPTARIAGSAAYVFDGSDAFIAGRLRSRRRRAPRPVPSLGLVRSVATLSGTETSGGPAAPADVIATTRASGPRNDGFEQRTRRSNWQAGFRRALIATDLLAAGFASVVAYVIRFGLSSLSGTIGDIGFAIFLPLGWVLILAGTRAYDRRLIGAGATEYDRVLRAFLYLAASITAITYVFSVQMARGYVLLALPLTPLLAVLGRVALRRRLRRRRGQGDALTSVLVVGDPAAIGQFAHLVQRDNLAGMRVAGACVPVELVGLPQTEAALAAAGVTAYGDVNSVREAALACDAQTVAVLSGTVQADTLRWVSAQLEGADINLVVSPGLTDVAGRRIHVQPVADLPLLYVDIPQFSGPARLVKTAFDKVVAAAALVLLFPLLMVVAAMVRLTSRGPAFFHQVRVGRDGELFTMIKFRTMRVDAEHSLDGLQQLNEATGVLFKIRADPRVTTVGRFLRRYSIDELPQLFNVLTGSMSLVGPRPPLPSEVSRYEEATRRRLLVKPGLTGLWQVSGRSDLSWEESVRLDLQYVENWSLALDLTVLFKTARAVLTSAGAY